MSRRSTQIPGKNKSEEGHKAQIFRHSNLIRRRDGEKEAPTIYTGLTWVGSVAPCPPVCIVLSSLFAYKCAANGTVVMTLQLASINLIESLYHVLLMRVT